MADAKKATSGERADEMFTVVWTGQGKFAVDVKFGEKPKRGKDTREQRRYEFGSSLDKGVAGQPQPEMTLTGREWNAMRQMLPVKRQIEKRALVVYQGAAV